MYQPLEWVVRRLERLPIPLRSMKINNQQWQRLGQLLRTLVSTIGTRLGTMLLSKSKSNKLCRLSKLRRKQYNFVISPPPRTSANPTGRRSQFRHVSASPLRRFLGSLGLFVALPIPGTTNPYANDRWKPASASHPYTKSPASLPRCLLPVQLCLRPAIRGTCTAGVPPRIFHTRVFGKRTWSRWNRYGIQS